MENRYYTGNQTYRPENTLINNSLYNTINNSQQSYTNGLYSQPQSSQSSGHYNGSMSPGRKPAQWWHSSGPFQPYRTTYQDYGHEKTLKYRTPNIHLTQPMFYEERTARPVPPESQPHRLDFDVPPSINGVHYS